MRTGHLIAAGVLVAAGWAPTTAAAAQVDDEGGDPAATEQDPSGIDPQEFILDIEATILDLDAGTGTTESSDETRITLDADVFFDFDQDQLRPDAQAALEDVIGRIQGDGATAVHIAGHTDSVGDPAYNQALSERRANAVRDFLAQRLPDVQMTTEGLGATQPVAPNTTPDGQDDPEGRALNRRVEITYPS